MIKVGTKVYHKDYGKGKVVEEERVNYFLVKFKKTHRDLHNGKCSAKVATVETKNVDKYYWLQAEDNSVSYVILDETFTFQVGDKVKVKKSIENPEYDWGKVKNDMVGIVVELGWRGISDKLMIDFEVQESWAGHAPEMAPVELVFPRESKVVPEPVKEEPKAEEFHKVIIGEKFTYKGNTYQVVPIVPWTKELGSSVQVVLLRHEADNNISFIKTEAGCNDAPYMSWEEGGDVTRYMKSYWEWC